MLGKFMLTVVKTTQVLSLARVEAEKNEWAVTIAVSDDDGGQLLSLLGVD